MNLFRKHLQGDSAIWGIMILFSLISLLAVYSASGSLAFRFRSGNSESFLIERALFLIVGLITTYLVHKMPTHLFSKLSVLSLIMAIPLLITTLLIGSNVNEASRWLVIPFTQVGFQPSDFAKISLVLYLAKILSKKPEYGQNISKGILYLLLPIALVCVFVLPANFSTAALIYLTSGLLLFIGGVNWKILSLMGVAAIGGLLLIVLVAFTAPKILPRFETWKNRIENFNKTQPRDAYQVEQAKMSIAQGWPIGTGPGNNTSKYRLPQSSSDFIFAFLIGEYGFILGFGFPLLLCFLILFYRIIRIANNTNKPFETIAALGLGIGIVTQAFVNMAVAVNVMPVTGQPLPFISSGGTSTLFTAIAVGIILSISKQGKSTPAVEEQTHE
jgi:cell division protein FtsW